MTEMIQKVDPAWSSGELAHALCDALVAARHLKEKPAFIRQDREAKIASIFEGVGLTGAKMCEFDNPGPLEMLVRKGTNGEAWVAQVVEALVAMMPDEVAHAAKKMSMDDSAKAELAAAKEKSAQRRDRLQAQEEEQGRGGERGEKGAGRGKGDRPEGREGGPPRERGERPRDDGERPERRDNRGDRGDRGGGRDGPREHGEREERGWGDSAPRHPPGEKGGGKGKGKRDRSAMQCLNCKQYGHKSRDCPMPVDEDAVRERLAAKAAGRPIVPPRGQQPAYDGGSIGVVDD